MTPHYSNSSYMVLALLSMPFCHSVNFQRKPMEPEINILDFTDSMLWENSQNCVVQTFSIDFCLLQIHFLAVGEKAETQEPQMFLTRNNWVICTSGLWRYSRTEWKIACEWVIYFLHFIINFILLVSVFIKSLAFLEDLFQNYGKK